MTQLNLAGQWSLSDDSGDYVCAINLPTDGISALHKAGLIPDPYWGRNEYDLRWIAERDWFATRTFTLTDTDVDLVLSGVDTIVEVVVNGQTVLQCDNAFRVFRVNLSDVAQVGENAISLTFKNSIAHAATLQDAQPFYLPYQEGNNPIPNVNLLRKPQCDYGWDWNIALAPFGIYGTLAIEPARAPRLDYLTVDQFHGDACVALTIKLGLSNYNGPVSAMIDGKTVIAEAVQGYCELSVAIQNPQIWWPAGQGDQPLYDLEVSFASTKATCRIGLRKARIGSLPMHLLDKLPPQKPVIFCSLRSMQT